jgi:hypothetical protein
MARDLRRLGPKPAEHSSVGRPCPACQDPFEIGDYTALVPIGPGRDPEEQALARAGLSYNAIALEVHWVCATGRLDDDG